MNPTLLKTETPNSTPIRNGPDGPNRAAVAPRGNRRGTADTIVAAFLLVCLGLAIGIVPRLRAQGKLIAASMEASLPTVVVTNVTRSVANPELILPANVRAFEETTLYSRANGYLSKWLVDIGGKVEAGQVL